MTRIPGAKKLRKRRGGLVQPPKSPEVKYRKQLDYLVKRLEESVRINIIPILVNFQSEYVNDGYATSLAQAFENLQAEYAQLTRQANIVANEFVGQTDSANKKRFYASIDNVIGVDLQSVIQNEGLENTLIASTRENVNLITSIPQQYLKNIESIVYTGTTQGTRVGSLIQQISKQGKTTEKRARLIARDQTAKINSALTQQRQQNLGIEEYVWITAKDDRVRESHKKNNGKVFRWDDPPKNTGHPGNDIQCRCIAQPIINL